MSVPATFLWFPGTEHEHTEPCKVGRVDTAAGLAHVTWLPRLLNGREVRRLASWEPLDRLTFWVGCEPWNGPSVTR